MSIQVFTSSTERLNALKNTRVDFAVETLLSEALSELGVNPFSCYLSTLEGGPGSEVGSSVTLYEAALDCIERQVMPTYDQGVSNVFNRRYSFAKEDRAERLDVIKFETMVIDMMLSLAKAPAMNLSSRRVKPLGISDLYAALGIHLPDFQLQNVYINGFVMSDQDKWIPSSSEQLADYLFKRFSNNEIPRLSKGDYVGVYSVAYSAEDAHLHPQLTVDHVNDLVIKLAQGFLS